MGNEFYSFPIFFINFYIYMYMKFVSVKGYIFLIKRECNPNVVNDVEIIKKKYKADLTITDPATGMLLFLEYVPDVEYIE